MLQRVRDKDRKESIGSSQLRGHGFVIFTNRGSGVRETDGACLQRGEELMGVKGERNGTT